MKARGGLIGLVTLYGLCWAHVAGAQSSPAIPSQKCSSQSPPQPNGEPSGQDNACQEPKIPPPKNSGRIFWLLPNFTTVEGDQQAALITTKEAFAIAAQDSFDPYVIPYLGLVLVGDRVTHQVPQWTRTPSGLGKLYGAAFADNTIGNFMTQAVVPWLARQDPRYFQRGTGGVFARAGYAVSRTVVTKSKTGKRQFNISEIGGNAIAAAVAGAYYPASERTRSAFLSRWGSQVLLDAIAFELKEFWPDIRRTLHK